MIAKWAAHRENYRYVIMSKETKKIVSHSSKIERKEKVATDITGRQIDIPKMNQTVANFARTFRTFSSSVVLVKGLTI